MILTITDLSRGGSGVARSEEGSVVFVPLTAPGDRVRVEITKQEKRYAQAKLLEVLEPSPQRRQPPCPVFGRCGGCQWQHLDYELQWKTKAGGARQALERVVKEGWQSAPWDLLPAEQTLNYRNRIQLRGDAKQIGFFAGGSKDLVAIDSCAIARPEINALIPGLKAEGGKRSRPYKVEVEVLPDGTTQTHWNEPHAAGGFRQVNDAQNEKLRAWVEAQVPAGRPVWDLYGGSGNLSRGAVASRAPRVDCVDVGAPRGQVGNAFFHRKAVAPWVAAQTQTIEGLVVISDPPREGMGTEFAEIVPKAEQCGARTWIAVGCDADSWARDLRGMLDRGWTVARLGAIDLFPQTPHVECLAVLENRGPRP